MDPKRAPASAPPPASAPMRMQVDEDGHVGSGPLAKSVSFNARDPDPSAQLSPTGTKILTRKPTPFNTTLAAEIRKSGLSAAINCNPVTTAAPTSSSTCPMDVTPTVPAPLPNSTPAPVPVPNHFTPAQNATHIRMAAPLMNNSANDIANTPSTSVRQPQPRTQLQMQTPQPPPPPNDDDSDDDVVVEGDDISW